MPGYNVHRIFNYTVFIVIAVLFYFRNLSFLDLKQFLALSAGFYIGTDFITPDLDVESRAINRWGKLKILWLPYKLMFRHGKSSHNIIYGAVVRLIYISLIIFGLYYLLFRSLPTDMAVLSVFVFILLTGIITANALHVILDMLF